MINLDSFINKNACHGVCKIGELGGVVPLPVGVRFVGEISVANDPDGLIIYVPYIGEVAKELRNFDFIIIHDANPFVLPHNYAYVGHALIPKPMPMGGYTFINVYVEKEL